MNWRTSLMFSRLSFSSVTDLEAKGDIYQPIEYVALNSSVLPQGITVFAWAKEHFNTLDFDYDQHSMLLWPLSDEKSASTLAEEINNSFPNLASVKLLSPALAHGLDETASLSFDSLEDSDEALIDSEINKNE